MNEILFLFHILVVVVFSLLFLRLGKSALISFISLLGILANLFVVKQMRLFGFVVTCSDVFSVGCILSLNLLQEFFGKQEARKAALVSWVALLFFALMAQVHLLYFPENLGMQDAFSQVLSSTVRIVLASVITFYLVQQFDVRFFGLLKGRFPLRVAVSLVCSQFLDTVLFSFLGLYGLVDSIGHIIFLSFTVKCLVIAAASPFTAFAKKVVKDVPV